MKDKNEFLKQMENLKVPIIDPQQHPARVKMAIMNSARSAAIGVWFIVIPCCFLLCVCIYYFFYQGAHSNWFASMYATIARLGNIPYIDFLAPVLLFVLPIGATAINALAIIHVGYENHTANENKVKELIITIKLKRLNILLIIISLLIIGAFMGYVMTTSISISN
jgi:hypothetical protein